MIHRDQGHRIDAIGEAAAAVRPHRRLAFSLLLVIGGVFAAHSPGGSQSPEPEPMRRYRRATELVAQGEVGQAVAILEELLADEELDHEMRQTVTAWLCPLYLQLDRPQAALDLIEARLRNAPTLDTAAVLLEFRADVWNHLGDRQRAEEDLRAAAALWDQYSDAQRDERYSSTTKLLARWIRQAIPRRAVRDGSALRTWLAGGILVLFALTTLINFGLGWKQTRQGRGTVRRLWGVAAALAALQVLPIAVIALIGTGGVTASTAALGPVLAGIYLLTYVFNRSFLGPPVYWRIGRGALPEVTGDAFLQRYHLLCRTMRLSPSPVVRMCPTLGSSLDALAFVGGLAAPSVVVTDGILHRLCPEEADSIVAHELGHLVNGSLWWFALIWIGVGPLAVVLFSFWMSMLAAVCLAATLVAGTRSIVSRLLELDCDLRAARAVGFRVMASGLEKVHVGLPYELTDRRAQLAMAISTHPSLDVRIGALADAAPPDDRPEVEWSRQRRMVCGFVSAAGLMCWLFLMALLVWVDRNCHGVDFWLPLIPLAVLMFPTLLLQSATKKSVRQQHRRQLAPGQHPLGARFWWTILVFVLIAGGTPVVAILVGRDSFTAMNDLSRAVILLLPMLSALLVLSLVDPWGRRTRKVNQLVLAALQQQDWKQAIQLGEQHSKLADRDMVLKHNLAIAKWLDGQEQQALNDLKIVEQNAPKLKQTYLTRGNMLLDSGQVHDAVDEARRLHRLDPHDVEAYLLAAQAFLSLSMVDQAEAQLAESDAAFPDHPVTLALRGRIAAGRGDCHAAAAFFMQAEKRAPALPIVRYYAAQTALNCGTADEAAQIVSDARRLIRAAPLSLLQHRLQRFSEQLEAISSGASTATIARRWPFGDHTNTRE